MTDSLRIRIADALRTMTGDLTYEAMADAVIRELGLVVEDGECVITIGRLSDNDTHRLSMGRTTQCQQQHGDLSVREFAALTNRPEQSVYRLCRQGRIPSYRVGKAVRIRRDYVESIRQSQQGAPNITDQNDRFAKVVAELPALTEAQCQRIAALLIGGGDAI